MSNSEDDDAYDPNRCSDDERDMGPPLQGRHSEPAAAADALAIRYGVVRYSSQQHYFWAVHEGDVPAACGFLLRGVSPDARMLPTDFDNAINEHNWPCSRFDGRYEDTALHMAVRCRDEKMVEALLRHGADPSLRNDAGETPFDIARGGGSRWSAAYLTPHNFGGSESRISALLPGTAESGGAEPPDGGLVVVEATLVTSDT